MADTNIRFRINSVFAGEGFTAANNAVSQIGRNAKQAIQPINQIAGALGQVQGPAGVAGRAINAFAASFQQFGVIGIAIAGVQAAFTLAANKIKDHYNEMAAAAEKSAARMKAKLNDLVDGVLGKTSNKLAEIGANADADAKSFDLMTAAAKKVSLAVGERESAAGAAEVVNLELEKLNAVIQAQNENVAALSSAEYDLKIATAKRTAGVEDATKKLKLAVADEKAASEKAATAQNLLTAAKNALRQAQIDLRLLEDAGVTDTGKLNAAKKNLTDAEKLAKQREDQFITVTADLKVAREKVVTEEIKLKTSTNQFDVSVTKAKDVLDKLTAAQERAKKISERKSDLENELADAQAERSALEKRSRELQESAESRREQAMSNLADAQQKSAQWEAEKKKLDEIKWDEGYKRTLENDNKLYNRASKAITGKRLDELNIYRDWLYHQGDNPWKQAIVNAEVELSAVDEEMKTSVKVVSEKLASANALIDSINANIVGLAALK